jgi:hypothetical protein
VFIEYLWFSVLFVVGITLILTHSHLDDMAEVLDSSIASRGKGMEAGR